MRKIRGLEQVKEVPPPGNRRGGTSSFAPSAGAGLAYEKKLAIAATKLGSVKHGQWFEYRDKKGKAYCQTDVLLLPPAKDRLILFECKLTQKAEGEVKLSRLYVPLVRSLYQLPVFPILAFQNILWQPESLIDRIEHVLEIPLREKEKVMHLHWIGV